METDSVAFAWAYHSGLKVCLENKTRGWPPTGTLGVIYSKISTFTPSRILSEGMVTMRSPSFRPEVISIWLP